MNNKRLNLAIIDQVAFTHAVAVVAVVAAAAPVGMKYLAARSMPVNATC
jgi:hypothetical protein